MNKIIIYPGRFMPFHKGHKSVYDGLVKKFGADNVYVASSAKQAPVSSPFAFEDKVKMMQLLGVPADKIVQVRNPYQPKEIIDTVDQDNTAIIFALSAKDAERFTFAPKKNGDPSYMQPYDSNNLKPLTQEGYILVVPTVKFTIGGEKVNSASEIRNMYLGANYAGRVTILKDLYGKAPKELKQIFDKSLAMTERVMRLMRKSNILTENVNIRRKTKILLDKVSILEQAIKDEMNNFRR